MEIENGLPAKPNSKLLPSTTRKEAKSARTGNNIIETIPPVYSGLSHNVEKAIVFYRFREIDEILSFSSGLRRSCQRRGKNVQEIGVPPEDESLFASGSPFHLCSSHTHYTSSLSQVLHRDYERLWNMRFLKKHGRGCSQKQESVAHIVRVLQ